MSGPGDLDISDAPWAVRAKEMGEITSWRSFANRGSNLAVWCQVTPLASTEDAFEALALAPQTFLPNPKCRKADPQPRFMSKGRRRQGGASTISDRRLPPWGIT
jgi:hypothetical protein